MMSDLPKGWAMSTLGECFFEIRNGTILTQNKDGRGIPVSRIETIQNSKFDMNRVRHIENISNELLKAFRYSPGDIALSHINSYEHVGKTALYDGQPERFLHGMNLLRLRLGHPFMIPKFAYLFMQTDFFRQEVRNRVGHAVNQVSINQANLSEVPMLIAPLNEQRRIVAKLEKLLGKVDACKERLEKIPTILKRFRQSVLSAACSGRLTADWREKNPDVEPAEELLKGIQGDSIKTKTSEKKKNQKDKFLDVNSAKPNSSELPDTWILCKLSLLAELITKGASPNWQGINYTDQGVLFITSENVGLGHLILENKKYVEERFNVLQKRSILMKGDLLTNIVGASIGRSAIFELDEKANINQAVALIRLNDEVNRNYILNVLNSPDLVEFMHQEKVDVARANLNLEDVSNFPIPFPPLLEQKEIVRRVEALFKIADGIEERYKKAKGYVDKLTQSILAKAFRGELVPQDPNDEPASVLLERIREERSKRVDKSQTGKTKNHRRQRRQNQLEMDI